MEEKGAVCGICFDPVSSRGQLTTCPHLFHYRCILQWSKIANLCPTCRVPFLEIRMYRKGHFVKSIAVERRQNTSSDDEVDSSYSESDSEDWQNRCQICGDDGAAGLILCDGEDGECTNAYHLRCVGLTAEPRGRWLCAECQSLEEFRREHPEEFALCNSSESESDPNFSDPGSESSVSYECESEVEGVDSTEAHSKPQSFVVSDDESNPSSQYDPPEDSESDSDQSYRAPSPKPEARRRSPRTRRNVRTMNERQRKHYIQRNLDPEHTPEDPIDQAWLIYRNIRNPRKRSRQSEEKPQCEETKSSPKGNSPKPAGSPSHVGSPKTKIPRKKTRSPEDFKKFVTELVQKELGRDKENDGLAAKIHHRQTVASLVKQIVQADKGRLRSDDRSVMKMKSRVRTALATRLQQESNQ